VKIENYNLMKFAEAAEYESLEAGEIRSRCGARSTLKSFSLTA
jgi:hypothetical protein